MRTHRMRWWRQGRTQGSPPLSGINELHLELWVDDVRYDVCAMGSGFLARRLGLSPRWGRGPAGPRAFYLLAAAVGVAAVLPVIYLVIRTVGAGSQATELLVRRDTFEVLSRSILLALAVTAGSVALGIPLAWLTARADLPLRRLWAVITVLPLIVPSYIAGFAMVTVLGPRGLVQQLMEGPFGVQRLPEIYGFTGAWLALTLVVYPYVLLPVRAALSGMDPALEEASRSLGRGPWSTFFRVTLPHLRPAIGAGGLLVALYTLSDFGAVSLLQFDSFTRVIFVHYQASFDRTLASVLSLVLVVLALVLVVGEGRLRSRGRLYSASGQRGPQPVVRLHRWRWPAVAIAAAVVLAGLGMTLSALLYWLAQGVAGGQSFAFIGKPIWNALYASALAAVVSVAAALPVAVIGVRFASRLARVVEGASYMGFAMPGVVVALALVFFGANFLPLVYQTLTLLIAAYVVLFLPLALGAIRSSLLQVSPAMEEAGRVLGRSWLAVLRTVTLPLIWPGVLVGAALVFLTTMKELPATLILGPTGFETLATVMWSAADEAFFARAALPGIVLIAVAAVPVALLLRQEGKAMARWPFAGQAEDLPLAPASGILRRRGPPVSNGAGPPAATSTDGSEMVSEASALGTPVIAAAGLTKSYDGGHDPAVTDLSFAVNRGETLAIVGPSGCGKTTTLRLLAGFEVPDSGEILVHDRVVASGSEWVPPEKRGLGMAFQQFALFPHMTALENVMYGLGQAPPVEKREKAQAMLDMLGMGGFGKRYAHQLSGGQQQRVALARALAPSPVVLLMDEPFASLDATLRSQLRREVRELLSRLGTTAVLVTHDQEEAFLMGDRVMVLHEGRLQQLNTPDNIYHRPINRLVARLVGLADFVPAAIEGRHVVTEVGRFPLQGEAPGPEVDLMVRPDDISVEPDGAGTGTIVEREFKGADNLYTVRLPSGRIVRSVQSSQPVCQVGTRVRVTARLAHVILFRHHAERTLPQ